jgi:hypothetical protein
MAITGDWNFDFTGYILGIAAMLYGCFAKRFRVRPKAIARWVWIAIGIICIIGNITQNIIEFQGQ